MADYRDSFVGIDLSYTRSGVAVYSQGSFYFNSYGQKIGKKNFQNLYYTASCILDEINGFFDELGVYPGRVVMEIPFHGSMFSPGLYALGFMFLDSIVYRSVYKYGRGDVDVKGLASSYIKYLHENKKASKKDSVILAKAMMELLTEEGFEFHIERRMNHDIAESFILLMRLLVCSNENPAGFSKELFESLENLCPRLFVCREVELLSNLEEVEKNNGV